MASSKPLLYEKSMVAYRRDLKKSDPISIEEESRLVPLAKAGDEDALERLVRANLKFVFDIANEYQWRGLSLLELIAEGNIGLLEGIRRFDAGRGFKLITYAVWWIRQAILTSLRKNLKVVNVPIGVNQKKRNLYKTLRILEQRLGRNPTSREIATEMGLRERDVFAIFIEEKRGDESFLNEKVFEERRSDEFLDNVRNNDPLADEVFVENEQIDSIQALLEFLDERDQKIIILYFGLGGGEPMTLDEIGRLFQLSRERIRQLKDIALQKLREVSAHLVRQ